MKHIFAVIGALALLGGFAVAQQSTSFTPEDLNRRTIERRAVDAVIWGLPLVGEDAVKQAAFRDGKATYNDIVWWPKGGGWKNQSPTPNVNTRYMYFFCNTKQDGPVVVELPPAVQAPASTAPSKTRGMCRSWTLASKAKAVSIWCCRPTTRATCRPDTSWCAPRPTTP